MSGKHSLAERVVEELRRFSPRYSGEGRDGNYLPFEVSLTDAELGDEDYHQIPAGVHPRVVEVYFPSVPVNEDTDIPVAQGTIIGLYQHLRVQRGEEKYLEGRIDFQLPTMCDRNQPGRMDASDMLAYTQGKDNGLVIVRARQN